MAVEPLFLVPIPVLCITGKHESGKSVMSISVLPTETCLFDFEESSIGYAKQAGVKEYINVPMELLKAFPNGYRPTDLFGWVLNDLRKRVVPGKFRVVVFDPVNEFEDGLAEYVRMNPGEFGCTHEQFQKMSGIMWGHNKAKWKSIIGDISVRTEREGSPGCLVLVSHMSAIYENNKPTGRLKPRSKSTLMEMAHLYLMMQREMKPDGSKPAVPSAVVLKQRLAHMRYDLPTRTMKMSGPILPPNMPEATIAAILKYMEKPADYSHLAPEERIQEEKLSEEERLQLEVARAEADRDAAQARLAETEQMARLTEMNQRQAADAQTREAALLERREQLTAEQGRLAASAAASSSAARSAAEAAQTTAAPAPAVPEAALPAPAAAASVQTASGHTNAVQMQKLVQLKDDMITLGGTEEIWRGMLAKRNVTAAEELTEVQADALINLLVNQVTAARDKKAAQQAREQADATAKS